MDKSLVLTVRTLMCVYFSMIFLKLEYETHTPRAHLRKGARRPHCYYYYLFKKQCGRAPSQNNNKHSGKWRITVKQQQTKKNPPFMRGSGSSAGWGTLSFLWCQASSRLLCHSKQFLSLVTGTVENREKKKREMNEKELHKRVQLASLWWWFTSSLIYIAKFLH